MPLLSQDGLPSVPQPSLLHCDALCSFGPELCIIYDFFIWAYCCASVGERRWNCRPSVNRIHCSIYHLRISFDARSDNSLHESASPWPLFELATTNMASNFFPCPMLNELFKSVFCRALCRRLLRRYQCRQQAYRLVARNAGRVLVRSSAARHCISTERRCFSCRQPSKRGGGEWACLALIYCCWSSSYSLYRKQITKSEEENAYFVGYYVGVHMILYLVLLFCRNRSCVWKKGSPLFGST